MSIDRRQRRRETPKRKRHLADALYLARARSGARVELPAGALPNLGDVLSGLVQPTHRLLPSRLAAFSALA
jgi:hypothetical protein